MAEAVATAPSAEAERQASELLTSATTRQSSASAGELAEIVLPFPSDYPLTDDLLEKLGDLSPQHLIERGPRGELIITPVARSGSGRTTGRLAQQSWTWLDAVGDGGEFDDAEAGIIVDGNSEVRQADFSYFSAEQVARMPKEGIEAGFADEVPAWAVEVRSKSQSVQHQVDRCLKWVADGAEVAWMIDPFNKTVHVIRADPSSAERAAIVVAMHERPVEIEVGPELPGLVIDFTPIWRD